MSHFSVARRLAALPCLLAGIVSTSMVGAAEKSNAVPGITKPSEQRDLSFNGPGVVAQVPVKEGDVVQADQLLASQDDTVEQGELAVLKVKAESNLESDAEKADLASKKVELARKQKMFDQKVLGASELEEAKLAVDIGEIKVQLAAQERNQKQLEAAEQQSKIKLKKLVSPIAGVVKKISTHAGELASADPTKPAITVVKNDPLWVEVNLPTAKVKSLAKDQSLEVRYADEDKWMPGKIIFIDPVADARSDTQLVRLEMPNPAGRQSGLQVQVRPAENLAAAEPALKP